MSLRLRVKKLIKQRRLNNERSFFIIAESLEQEVHEINKIKSEFKGADSLLMITVFKLYE